MLQKKYHSKIVSILNPFKGLYTLEFRSLGRKYKFHPGQFLHLAIDPNYEGFSQWPDSRCFSMQSNPDEDTIKITYTVKGTFTSQMEKQLNIGSEVWLKLPYGDLFTQQHNKLNTVFIAGGTGITPFLSLFTHDSFNEYVMPKIYIGFRASIYNIYQFELDHLLNSSKFVKFYFEDTDGVLDIAQIFIDNGIDSNYFISGPPVMIETFKIFLIEKGVHTNNVLTDNWE